MGRPPEMSESEGERREKRGRRGQYKRTTFTQRGKQKQMQHANIQFHTILVRTPLSRARGIQRRYSPQEGTVSFFVVVTKDVFCRDEYLFVATKHLFSHNKSIIFGCDKRRFARRILVCRDKTPLCSQQKYAFSDKTFVATTAF